MTQISIPIQLKSINSENIVGTGNIELVPASSDPDKIYGTDNQGNQVVFNFNDLLSLFKWTETGAILEPVESRGVKANSFIGKNHIDNEVDDDFDIDCSNLFDCYILTLEDDIEIGFANMIDEDETLITYMIVTGEHGLAFDEDIVVQHPDSDDYDGEVKNLIVIALYNGGANAFGTYYIRNLNSEE